jgi:hypothetical protein
VVTDQLTKQESVMLCEKQFSAKFSGNFGVRIIDIKPCPRYPNEMCNVCFGVREPGGRVREAEFVLKYADPFFLTYGLKVYRDVLTDEIPLPIQRQAAEILQKHVVLIEEAKSSADIHGEVTICFADDTQAARPMSNSVIWTHIGGFQKT